MWLSVQLYNPTRTQLSPLQNSHKAPCLNRDPTPINILFQQQPWWTDVLCRVLWRATELDNLGPKGVWGAWIPTLRTPFGECGSVPLYQNEDLDQLVQCGLTFLPGTQQISHTLQYQYPSSAWSAALISVSFPILPAWFATLLSASCLICCPIPSPNGHMPYKGCPCHRLSTPELTELITWQLFFRWAPKLLYRQIQKLNQDGPPFL